MLKTLLSVLYVDELASVNLATGHTVSGHSEPETHISELFFILFFSHDEQRGVKMHSKNAHLPVSATS
jgi:hypothetical protein